MTAQPAAPTQAPDWLSSAIRKVKRWLSVLIGLPVLLFLALVFFGHHLPKIPGLHPRLTARVCEVGGRHALIVYADPDGPPVKDVAVRVIRPGQTPDAWFDIGTLLPAQGATVGSAASPATGLPPREPYWVQPGDEIILLGEPRRFNVRYHFSQLKPDPTPVTYAWDVKFGVLNDDILLTNTSPTALTSVVFRVHIESVGRTWDLELKHPRVDPRQTVTWTDVLSVPGSNVDAARSHASLACDQSPAEK
jgi:hypothetical protein